MRGNTEYRDILDGKSRCFNMFVIPEFLADFLNIGAFDSEGSYESGHLRVGRRQDAAAFKPSDPFFQVTRQSLTICANLLPFDLCLEIEGCAQPDERRLVSRTHHIEPTRVPILVTSCITA